MKNILLSLFTLVLTLAFQSAFAQTGVGGCSTATLTSPNFSKRLIAEARILSVTSACRKTVQPIKYGHARFFLQRLDEVTGQYTDVAGPFEDRVPASQSSTTTFGEVTINVNPSQNGTFRGRINVPIQFTIGCGDVVYFGLNAVLLGGQATWGGDIFTDPFIVGPTTQDDAEFSFLNTSIQSGVELYERSEVKQLSFDSQNFNRYRVQLFEQGGNNNFATSAWLDGTPTIFNLADIYPQSWFVPGIEYRIQVITENSDCLNGVWNNTNNSFEVCPNGSGCRTIMKEKEIEFFPNPTTGEIRFNNLPLKDGKLRYQLQVWDLTGRLVKELVINQPFVNIQELNSGMYLIGVRDQGELIYSERLTIK